MKQKPGAIRISMLAGCLTAQICVGIIYLWSVFKASAISYYGWEDGSVNLVASFMLFSFCVGNLGGGALQDRTNPRLSAIIGIFMFGGGILASSLIPADGSILLFYATYCVLGGVGCGFVYGSAINCLQRWMPHRRGLATGMAVSAFGLSTVVFSPVCNYLLNLMSMPQALRTLAGLLSVIGFIACLFISRPDEAYLEALRKSGRLPEGESLSGKEGVPLSQAARTLPYWLLFLAVFFYNSTFNMLNPLIKGLGIERGLGEATAVLAVSLTGVTNSAGRLLVAALSDKLGRMASFQLMCLITFVSALLLVFAGGSLYLVVVLFVAFAFGGPAAVVPAFCTDMFGSKYSGSNYGVMMLALGLSSIAFNSLSNVLYAASGDYTLTFLMGAALTIVTSVLLIGVQKFSKKLKFVK